MRIRAVTQEIDRVLRHLRGSVLIQTSDMKLTADEIDYNEDTGDAEARGHVHFEHLTKGEVLDSERAEYNTETETGKFYEVTGTAPPRIQARRGLLTTENPFYFQGRFAERIKNEYILHDGFLTDCKIPRPWWRLKSSSFVVVPEDHAITKHAIFYVRRVPIFYFPYFYKSLKKEPRKSGFLMPNIGNSSTRGQVTGVGYYWAVNRSYDLTYRANYFTTAGLAHHLDVRGNPNDRTTFSVLVDGIKDQRPNIPSGALVLADVRSYLGRGWEARGDVDYISSYAFRQNFTSSYNEAVLSQTHSVGYVTKHWSHSSLNLVTQRNVNYVDATPGNDISIRKLPEANFVVREHMLTFRGQPFWFSMDSDAGLLKRSHPAFQTRSFVPRLHVAPHITSSFRWAGLQLTPSVGLQETLYASHVGPFSALSGDNLLQNSREVSVDLVLPSLERVFAAPSFLGEKVKHVIEPRIVYRKVAGIGDLSQNIRFDEIDVLTNTNQVEFTLSNRLLAKEKNGTATDLLTWELRFDHYFDPTFGGAIIPNQRNILQSELNLTGYSFLDGVRHSSPIVSSLRFQQSRGGFEWRADYDPIQHRFVNTSTSVYERLGQFFFVASHNSLKPDPILAPSANQFLGRVVYGSENRRGLSYGVDTRYDIRSGQLLNLQTQVTYNTDCCGLSFQYRRWEVPQVSAIRRNEYRVAFAVSNIGTFGNIKRQERVF